MTIFVRRAKYSQDTSATTTSTTREVVSVNLVLRLSGILLQHFVLFQFVVQGFEADPEQFGRAGFVLVRGSKRLKDKFALRGVHRSSHREPQARKHGRFCRRRVAEVRR